MLFSHILLNYDISGGINFSFFIVIKFIVTLDKTLKFFVNCLTSICCMQNLDLKIGERPLTV